MWKQPAQEKLLDFKCKSFATLIMLVELKVVISLPVTDTVLLM